MNDSAIKLAEAVLLYSKVRIEKYKERILTGVIEDNDIVIYQAKMDELSELYFAVSEFLTTDVFYVTKDIILKPKDKEL